MLAPVPAQTNHPLTAASTKVCTKSPCIVKSCTKRAPTEIPRRINAHSRSAPLSLCRSQRFEDSGNRAAPTGPLEIALLSADATANSVM